MRLLLFYALAALIAASITLATGPGRRAAVPQSEEASCCAFMKMGSPMADCGHQTPKSNEAQQCCASCPLLLAVLVTAKTPFLHSPSGEEYFGTVLVAEYFRSDRPPDPPPRRLPV